MASCSDTLSAAGTSTTRSGGSSLEDKRDTRSQRVLNPDGHPMAIVDPPAEERQGLFKRRVARLLIHDEASYGEDMGGGGWYTRSSSNHT